SPIEGTANVAAHRKPSPWMGEGMGGGGEAWGSLRPELRRRVDHLAHFGDLSSREAADLGVLLDDVLVLGEVDTKRLVGGDIAFDPLDVGAKLTQDAVGLGRGAAELFALEAADRRDVTLDDEFAECHLILSGFEGGAPVL